MRFQFFGIALNNMNGKILPDSIHSLSNTNADNDYPRIYEYVNPLKPGRTDPGFPTNSLTRPLLIDELDKSLREGVGGVQGIRTVNELLNFCWSRSGKAEAQSGKHDDLVIALGIGRYVRQHSVREVDFPVLLS